MNLKRSILKFWIIRFVYVTLRYLYLKKFCGVKYKYDPKSEVENLAHCSDDNDSTIKHNTNYLEYNIFKRLRIYFIPEFLGLRCNRVVNPLIELPFISKKIKKLKILSIGPRDEGELYNLFTKGFEWENIYAIDLFSYSKKIKVGDVHDLDYPENFFDIALSSYTLTYSNDQKLFIKNLVKCTKKGGTIAIACGNIFNHENLATDYKNYDEFLDLFNEHIERIYFRNYSEDYLVDENKHDYLLIFKVKK